MKLVCKSSYHKVLLGRLAAYILGHNVRTFGFNTYIVTKPGGKIVSVNEAMELSLQLQGKPYNLEKELSARDWKLGYAFTLVPLAMALEFEQYIQTQRLEDPFYHDALNFLVGEDAPWQIREFLRPANSSYREIVARITILLNKPIWEDSNWLDSLNNKKNHAGFKLRGTLEKELTTAMAFVESWYYLEQNINANEHYDETTSTI